MGDDPFDAVRGAVLGRTAARICTPPLRPLSPVTSLGWDFAEFCDSIGVPLLNWQRWAAERLLELREDGSFRFRTGLIMVGRQCGKSSLSALLILWFLYRRGARLVVGMAQSLDVARETWTRVEDLIADADGILDAPRVYRSNGKERIEWPDGRRYLLKAANRRARGLSPDLIVVDELREQTDWDAWQAVSAMTLARSEGMVLAFSSAGDDTSVVLNSINDSARAAIDATGDGGDVFLAEWSAPDGADVNDPQSWGYGMPSLGRTVTLAAVEGLRATLPPGQFRTEVLNQRTAHGRQSAIDLQAWSECADPSGTLDHARGRIALCLDVAPGGHSSLAAAGMDRAGIVTVELVRAWNSPAEARLELAEIIARIKPRKVAWFASSPATALAQDVKIAAGKMAIKISDPAEACVAFASLIAGRRLRHAGQSLLNEQIAGAARTPRGSMWVFERHGVDSISAVYAVAGATLLARQMPAATSGKLIVAA